MMHIRKTQNHKTTRISLQDGDRPAKSQADRGLNKVVPVRLPEDKWELMRDEANELGIGPSTLARIWILDSLRKTIGNNRNGNDKSDRESQL